MKLIIYNGSPRGKGSNTRILMDQFINGFRSKSDHVVETRYLSGIKGREEGASQFVTADWVIIAFPLYTDSMPGIVKEFIELLAPLKGREDLPKLGFVVQSGFPEPAHSRYVERYLEKFTHRLGAEYLGTIVKGGVEGIKIMPGWMTRKLRSRFFRLGSGFADTNAFNARIQRKLAPSEKMGNGQLRIFRLMQKTSMGNFYWNGQLKENKAFERRFDAPYAR